jgi:glutaminyl-peptide cyclotransferase
MKSRIIVFVIGLVIFGACQSEKKTEEESIEISYKEVPEFNADSAYAYIEQQVNFGPRVPGTEGHQKTRKWLVEKFESMGWKVTEQNFQAETYDKLTWNLTNIIASYNPSASKRILLAAHWDTRRMADKDTERINQPIDGANDGGSGVGVLLEIARSISLSDLPLEIGIDIVLFDGEDDGEPEFSTSRDYSKTFWCLGSQHWSLNPHLPNYTAFYGILLDMVGGKNAKFHREGFSLQYAKNIVNTVWNNAHNLGYSNYFILRDAPEVIDDHLFVNKNRGIPMIDIIDFSPESGFGYYHHTHMDNMENIDKNTLKAVGKTVLFTLYQE